METTKLEQRREKHKAILERIAAHKESIRQKREQLAKRKEQ